MNTSVVQQCAVLFHQYPFTKLGLTQVQFGKDSFCGPGEQETFKRNFLDIRSRRKILPIAALN